MIRPAGQKYLPYSVYWNMKPINPTKSQNDLIDFATEVLKLDRKMEV